MIETVTVSSRIERTISEKLDILSKATARSRSFLINEAIKSYVNEQAWQIEAIKEGIERANAGKFASDKEISKTFAKYGVDVNAD